MWFMVAKYISGNGKPPAEIGITLPHITYRHWLFSHILEIFMKAAEINASTIVD